MKEPKKTIITCAVTGSSLTPSQSPYLPVTGDEIAQQGIDAAKAGASILHLHARQPSDGQPTNDPAVWETFVPRLKKETDAIINMSASMGPTAEERVKSVLAMRPDIATVIVGSMNYARFKKADDQGVSNFKYDWEREFFYGAGSRSVVTNNTFEKIGKMIDIFIAEDIAMEFECFDVGHLYILDHHLQTRSIKGPLIVQFLTGILGGIPSEIDHLLHMKRTAERLFGDDCVLFMHGTGPRNIRAATYGGLMGTHVRVGQEDNLVEKPGSLFKSNAHQVSKLASILTELNIEIATPAEARAALGIAPRESAAQPTGSVAPAAP